ncbi:unnamed protein product [Owenia fusiformis]|uniref:Uncharacterized protein n=1 Tax=Owenia fusiformis TaxID=6347 RepID=A0A8S4P3H6_OWEFU|nr:unnamed protein product [Owenia fusiformis]
MLGSFSVTNRRGDTKMGRFMMFVIVGLMSCTVESLDETDTEDLDTLKQAAKKALEEIKNERIAALFSKIGSQQGRSGMFAMGGGKEFVEAVTLPYLEVLEIIKEIKKRYALTKPRLIEWLRHMGRLLAFNNTQITDGLPHVTTPECLESFNPNIECNLFAKFRTFDGSCNNARNPLWGRAKTPFIRFLTNAYADGKKEPRVARDRTPLPSARLVSRTIHQEANKPSAVQSMTVMTLGQLLDHDIDKTAQSKLPNPQDPSKPIDITCGEDNCGHDYSNMEECLPIKVPEGDSCFKKTKCLKFIRSQPVLELNCLGDLKTMPRQHLNTISSYLDCSFVYGNSEKEVMSLREDNNSGRMLMSTNPLHHDLKPLLPPFDSKDCVKPNVNDSVKCMRTGDGRANEWIGLTSFHVIFARQHNRIADELARINPDWSNESNRLFLEARRILIALWQRIIYGEYLPVVMGSHYKRYDLALLKKFKKGYFSEYDEWTNAQASNVFQGAAFRFGHSQIDTFIRFISDNRFKKYIDDHITSHQFRPSAMYGKGDKGGVDTIVRGHVHLPSQNTDAYFTEQMSCHMFTKDPPFGEGTDLPALNIQRGREHGLPGYNKWREYCNLPKIKNWKKKPAEIPEAIWGKLPSIYTHVDDIDIFTGGISEVLVPYGAVGPTFACLLGKQFENLRKGDRYWHENMGPGMFSQDQLTALDKGSSLARIMCETSDDIQFMQPKALLLPYSEIPKDLRNSYHVKREIRFLYGKSKNERVDCRKLPKLDLSAWKQMD